MSVISKATVQDLSARVEGEVFMPGDAGFVAACRVWNTRFQHRPALVVRCRSEGDVQQAVRFASGADLIVSVRGGGHDYAGNTVAEDSLLIDFSEMRGIELDAAARRVRIEPGCCWREVDAVTTPAGLAASGGTVSSVGVAGFSLGGGAGWLARKAGLAVDNLIRARVVTADGQARSVSADEHPDLFWALRGGGGNFGVVTRFEHALHSIPAQVLSGQVLYPAQRAPELLRRYRALMSKAPDALTCFPFLLRVPPIEPFPSRWHGELALDFVLGWFDDPAEGEAHLAPFRAFGDPILDAVGLQPYAALQQAFDAGMGSGPRWYSRALQFDRLSDSAIDTLVEHLDPFPGAFTTVYLAPGGGAVSRPAADATAWPHRSSSDELHILPGWTDPAEDQAVMAWADRLLTALEPHGNGGVYVNLLGDGEPDRTPSAYRGNYDRLREIKATWDPENRFSANHNIPPAT